MGANDNLCDILCLKMEDIPWYTPIFHDMMYFHGGNASIHEPVWLPEITSWL
jgi:hypothetical protein